MRQEHPRARPRRPTAWQPDFHHGLLTPTRATRRASWFALLSGRWSRARPAAHPSAERRGRSRFRNTGNTGLAGTRLLGYHSRAFDAVRAAPFSVSPATRGILAK